MFYHRAGFTINTHNNDTKNWQIIQKNGDNDDNMLHNAHKILRNKRIVFIGDSLTRYQYLNFVHVIHKNSWTLSDYPSFENEHQWQSWHLFHTGTSLRLGCQEICDCYRNDTNFKTMRENRYYYDINLNLSISLLFWTPPMLTRLSYLPTVTFLNSIEDSMRIVNNYDGAAPLRYDILNLLDQVIKPMQPDVLIVNQGFWTHKLIRDNVAFRNKFAAKLYRTAKYAVWKKTTTPCSDNPTDRDGTDFLDTFIKKGIHIYDTYKLTWSTQLKWCLLGPCAL